MKLHEFVAIGISASVPVLIAVIGFRIQSEVNRDAAYSERRRSLYEELIQSLVALLGARTPSERSRLLTQIEASWLFASDRVLLAIYAYLAAYDTVWMSVEGEDGCPDWDAVFAEIGAGGKSQEQLRARLADVFMKMRLDMKKDHTELPESWADEKVKLYPWGVLDA